MCTIFRTGYEYIYLVFCGDPFFHLRAHPTPDDDVGREDGVGSSRPQWARVEAQYSQTMRRCVLCTVLFGFKHRILTCFGCKYLNTQTWIVIIQEYTLLVEAPYGNESFVYLNAGSFKTFYAHSECQLKKKKKNNALFGL